MGCGSSLNTIVHSSVHQPTGTLDEACKNSRQSLHVTIVNQGYMNQSSESDLVPTTLQSKPNLAMESSLGTNDLPEIPALVSSQEQDKTEPISSKEKTKREDVDVYTLDPQEVKNQIRERFERLNKLDEYRSDECLEDLKFLYSVAKAMDANQRALKNTYIDEMIHYGLISLFKNIMQFHLNEQLKSPEAARQYNIVRNIIVVMWNGTDCSKNLCEEAIKVELYKNLFEYLNMPVLLPGENEHRRTQYVVKGCFGILHNIIQVFTDVSEAYRSCGAVQIINKYRSSELLMIKCKAEFNLAYLATEEENAQLNANAENIKFMGDILAACLKEPEHYSKRYGYRAHEVLAPLNRLAANDDNKMKIVETGLLKYYAVLLDPSASSEQEQLLAAKGLWTLAFKVKEQIIKEPGCMSGLNHLAEHGASDEIKRAVNGALWILEGKDEESHADASKLLDVSCLAPDEARHVMISYQWDTKPVMLKLRDKLRLAGHKVWMDVDNMSGSILEAMANAVEQAKVVVICLSQKYKESPSCRTEAEYAYRCQKPIVPLLLQKRYRPDGWLGAIAGNRLYFDLSQEHKYEAAVEGFVREIQKFSGEAPIVPLKMDAVDAKPTLKRPNDTVTWSESRVSDWLIQNELKNEAAKFSGMDGSLLLEMKSMFHHAPEFFYTTLKDEMKLSLLGILKFTKAMKTLPGTDIL